MRTLLLDYAAILQKTKRIAYQIVEDNFSEKEIVLIGIAPNGNLFSDMLKKEIELISNKIKVQSISISLNKLKPLSEPILLDTNGASITNKTVIIVDDVANTGRTAFFALKPIIEENPKKVQVAVLIDRRHKLFPIYSDYVGLSLSTTMKEHILVEFSKKKVEAYLD